MKNSTHKQFSHNLQLAQPTCNAPQRLSIKPMALLDVVRRRGRSWGLLAQYEEARLGLSR